MKSPYLVPGQDLSLEFCERIFKLLFGYKARTYEIEIFGLLQSAKIILQNKTAFAIPFNLCVIGVFFRFACLYVVCVCIILFSFESKKEQ